MANDKADQMKELTDKLEQGVKNFFNSGRLEDYLKVMSKFHHYSVNNTILIAMQRPDARLVAGYNTWKKEFERQVMKGEKAIKILAPAPYKIKTVVDKTDDKGNIVYKKNGEAEKEEVELTIPKFKPVNVFDVSQTEGKEISELILPLEGNVEQFQDFFVALNKVSSVPVGFESIKNGAHGYYHPVEKRIAINEGESEIQTIKTLIHEIAHSQLHDHDRNKEIGIPEKDRLTREVEAESVAYVVCQHFGIDTSQYSFGYVAGWSSGKEMVELKSSLETIRATASDLITNIEKNLSELQKEKSLQPIEKSVLHKLKENKSKIANYSVEEKERRRSGREVER